MKDFFVADAAQFDGQTVTTYFAVSSFSVREKKGAGGQYLALILSDKTGSMEARMWEDFASAMTTCAEGCYVKVQGQDRQISGQIPDHADQDAAGRGLGGRTGRLCANHEVRY